MQGYVASILFLSLLLPGCVTADGHTQQRRESDSPRAAEIRRVDPRQAERLYRIMTPLLRGMDNPRHPREVRIGIIEDREINAANAGGGQFYVTTGLLQRADDRRLLGVMAHEIAHDDLGHVAQLERLGAGLNLGVVLLEQLIPGSSAITPIAGALIARGYSRSDEHAADRHGVEILRRAGYSKEVMIDALKWVTQESGGKDGGGFLSTHPAITERIAALRRLN